MSDGVNYLMAGSQAWKSRAEKVKGELSAVAATVRLLLGQNQGGGGLSFDSVAPWYKAALDSHDAVEKRYPGDAMVEAATNPCLQAPHARRGPGLWELHWHCKPVVSPCERPFLTLVHYTGD